MATVYIVQRPKPNDRGWLPNYTPATQYGKLAYIFESGEKAWTDPEEAMDIASERLKNFNPEEDFILYSGSGDPATLWATLLTLARWPLNKINFLYWERGIIAGERRYNDGFYSPVTFTLR